MVVSDESTSTNEPPVEIFLSILYTVMLVLLFFQDKMTSESDNISMVRFVGAQSSGFNSASVSTGLLKVLGSQVIKISTSGINFRAVIAFLFFRNSFREFFQ